MGTIPRLVAGERLNGISAEGWNRFRAATLAVEEAGQVHGVDLSELTGLPSLQVEVMRSGSGSDLQTYSVVGLEKPVGEIPSDLTEPPLDQFFLDAVAPTEGEPFGILSTSLDATDNSGGEATYAGYTWAKVDIQDEEDTTCNVETDNYDNLVSGTGSIPMEWKPEGTGIKWVIVRLGVRAPAAGQQARAMITGDIPAAVFNGATKEVTPGYNGGAVCTIMVWDEDSGKLVADPDYPSMPGSNDTSTSKVAGSVDQPVVMPGTIETRYGEELFVLDPFDLYSLEGNIVGSVAAGDDPDMRIPYKPGGGRLYKVDSEDCGA